MILPNPIRKDPLGHHVFTPGNPHRKGHPTATGWSSSCCFIKRRRYPTGTNRVARLDLFSLACVHTAEEDVGFAWVRSAFGDNQCNICGWPLGLIVIQQLFNRRLFRNLSRRHKALLVMGTLDRLPERTRASPNRQRPPTKPWMAPRNAKAQRRSRIPLDIRNTNGMLAG